MPIGLSRVTIYSLMLILYVFPSTPYLERTKGMFTVLIILHRVEELFKEILFVELDITELPLLMKRRPAYDGIQATLPAVHLVREESWGLKKVAIAKAQNEKRRERWNGSIRRCCELPWKTSNLHTYMYVYSKYVCLYSTA